MGKVFGGGVSASSNNASGTQQVAIDPEVQRFVNQDIIGSFRNLISNIPGLNGGETPSSYIAPQSQDTQDYYSAVRGLDPSASSNPNINAVANNLMTGGWNVGAVNAAQAGPAASTNVTTGASMSSPYMSDLLTGVINPTLNEFDTQAARAANTMRAGRDAGTAFGDRAAVADAVFRGESDRSRALLQSNLLKDAYTTATGYGFQDAAAANTGALQDASHAFQGAQRDADRRQQADQFNIGTQFQNIANAIAGTGIASGQDSADWMRQLQAMGLLGDSGADQDAYNTTVTREPLDIILQAASIAGGVPYGTTTTTQNRSRGKGAAMGSTA